MPGRHLRLPHGFLRPHALPGSRDRRRAPACGAGPLSDRHSNLHQRAEKVAYLNGISRDRPGWLQSWQHSTIAKRVAFLESVLTDPGQEPRFQRHVGRVKWGLFLTMACLLLAFGTVWGWGGLLGLPATSVSSH